VVNKRPERNIQSDKLNGDIELEIKGIEVLNESEPLPFDISEDTSGIDEQVRLKYRYVDLRSSRMQKNMRTRSEFIRRCRAFLFDKKFTEIETPLLTESTPEGSRDFVVPSRLNPGKFYALPQSPQQYKQLLMTAGFERYFQVARAIRDEDLRADRGFEHTQLDIEMSFVTMEEVMEHVEHMIIDAVEGMGHTIKEKPFPRISYKDAMEKYGADKFDMRTEEDKPNGVLAYAWVVNFPFFEKTDDGKWTFTHNPFSMPIPEHLDWLMKGEHIEDILTTQYDLVCNGFEAGGGSIRAHKAEILEATYKVMGYSEEEMQERVGHMLEAFKLGTPPHGGIALGVERNVMNLTSEDMLREVQAFPMTRSGQTSVMKAPKELDDKQLKELGISIDKRKE
jgi:aspartyl-tRNA synthetase